jgi:DNA-binding phage protein
MDADAIMRKLNGVVSRHETKVAEAGISREYLCRTLSYKGNPTLQSLLAVLKTVGMRLSIAPEQHAHA